jgi:hypothetical protein
MPDLEARLREWKQALVVAFGGSEEIVDELESHLREEIDRLTQAGQVPEAALAMAQVKLGRPVDLAAEYARAATPAWWLPIPLGLALFVLLFGSFLWAVCLPLAGKRGDALLASHVAAVVAGYAAAFYAGVLGICYVVCWLVRPIGLGQRRSLGRTLAAANAAAALLLLTAIVLGGVWAHAQWGSAWNNDPREIGTSLATLWFAVLSGLCWALPRRQHLWVLLSIVGIGVGVWGWVGPSLFRQLHAYGSYPGLILGLLVAGTVVSPTVALLGLLPPGRLWRQTA